MTEPMESKIIPDQYLEPITVILNRITEDVGLMMSILAEIGACTACYMIDDITIKIEKGRGKNETKEI